jgi:hypothetical protein
MPNNETVGWGIHIEGPDFDLQTCVELMPRNFDPWVEEFPHGDQKIYVLRSAELDNCSSAIEVHMKTQDLGYRFKGALAALYGIGPINTREVLQLFSGGSWTPHYFAQANMTVPMARVRGAGTVTSPDGSIKQHEVRESPLQRLMNNDAREVKEALMFLSRADNWFDIYKAWEVMKCNYSNDSKTPEHKLKDDAGFGDDFKRFTGTANYWRHYKDDLPEHPMEISEARAFAFKLFRFWLDSPNRAPRRKKHPKR